ncbi:hypothetical protein GH714_025062 [Hevea brasiliensis]|uniref:Chalcone isomerase domain-containing protein n=1 Tax=Hevea brasiliensis TaxID=3981 RepID=A0A6A6NJ25_HEVBR|nr:hypothetical protein GH714_025062 [Hevea brasiliensis]
MVSLRFPFLFSQPKRPNDISHATTSRSFSATTVVACAFAAGAAAFSGIAVAQKTTNPKHSFLQNAMDLLLPNHSSLPWGSLSLADTSLTVVESKTGVSFPSVASQSRRLLGMGLRRKSILGLKNIDVYAFGVYADDNEVKKVLGEKYGKLSISELKENKEFKGDLMGGDIGMTVRLQIVYGKLSIRSVRSAFEESVGSRLQKFGGQITRNCFRVDGKEVGSIQSKLLCRSILDLYMGEDPFDRQAKEEIESKLASFLQK